MMKEDCGVYGGEFEAACGMRLGDDIEGDEGRGQLM